MADRRPSPFKSLLGTKVLTALVCALLVGLLPTASFAEDCSAAVYGAESPQALIEGLQTSARNGDFGSMTTYLPNSVRVSAAASFTVAAKLMVQMRAQQAQADGTPQEEIEKIEARLDGIYSRHGVAAPSDEVVAAAMEQRAGALDDLEASMADVCTDDYLGDMAPFLADTAGQSFAGQMEKLANQEVGSIAVEGDEASIQFGRGFLNLNRVGGRWFLVVNSTSELFGAS